MADKQWFIEVQDDDGHHYIIPEERVETFHFSEWEIT
jgi:hypothetical protein